MTTIRLVLVAVVVLVLFFSIIPECSAWDPVIIEVPGYAKRVMGSTSKKLKFDYILFSLNLWLFYNRNQTDFWTVLFTLNGRSFPSVRSTLHLLQQNTIDFW